MKRHLSWVLLLAAPLLLSTSPEVSADPEPNDSTLFQFVRIRYHGFVSSWGGGRGRWVPPWMHDYPRAEQNFLKIFMELTGIETTPESYLVLDLNDPRIMNYPALYVSEPGYWNITGEEAANLREYLLRGGFVIFDDFRGAGDWHNFTSCMQQVYPERGFEELTTDHPVFHCFYDIDSLDMLPPYNVPGKPSFYGLSDEDGRLLAVANFNNDIGDYWEWSDESLVPISASNEAYKLGINYFVYALTH